MKKAVLCFGLVISFAALGIGQVRTVTNSTLNKFQQKRLDADRDYRDNYARLGFPSPEELDRQRDVDMAARLQLADQLRTARLAKERIDLERQNLALQAARMEQERDQNDSYNSGYYGGYGGYGGYFGGGYGGFSSNGGIFDGRFGNRRGGRFRGVIGGYRATPFGVYPEPASFPRPFFRVRSGGTRRTTHTPMHTTVHTGRR